MPALSGPVPTPRTLRSRTPAAVRSRVVAWAFALALAFVACAGAQAGTAPGGVELNGEWAPAAAGAPATRMQRHAFDPARLRSFGDAPDGAQVWLTPRASAWPAGPLVLSVPSPGFQRFALQWPGSSVQVAQLLDAQPGRWPAHGRIAFDIATPPAHGAPLVVHVDARGVIASPITFEVRSVAEHLRIDARWLAFATACLAAMAATALIALFFGLRLRDGAFALYSAYVLSYAAILATQTGYLVHPLDWQAAAASLPVWGRAVTTLSVVAAVLFLDRFASLERWLPSMRRWLHGYCAVMLVLFVAGYVPGLQQAVRALINPMLILGGPLLLGVAGAAAWRGSRFAALFLLGWVPLLAVTVLGSAQLYGVALGWTWVSDAALAAGAFESIVLSLGLAERAASVRRQRDQARVLADIDPLTGLLNRRAWRERINARIQHLRSHSMTLLFLDLDHFKQVNDRIGHDGGDRVLELFTAVLKGALREQDIVGRYGGEEFIVGLPGTDAQQAREIADRIRTGLRERSADASGGTPLTVSVGVATLRPDETLDALLRRADAALYAAKSAGRDRVELG